MSWHDWHVLFVVASVNRIEYMGVEIDVRLNKHGEKSPCDIPVFRSQPLGGGTGLPDGTRADLHERPSRREDDRGLTSDSVTPYRESNPRGGLSPFIPIGRTRP